MTVSVDRDLCEANGVCVGLVPEVFHLDDQDDLQILQPEPGPELLDRVRHAVGSCPRTALRMTD